MSRSSSPDNHGVNEGALEIIREEQCSPATSSVKIEATTKTTDDNACRCVLEKKNINEKETEEVDKIIMEKELALRKEFEQHLQREIDILKERFDYILHNEQIRSSYMLREAHRERQEKIAALTGQLECKNLAGLTYVMCTERRKSKMERLRVIQEYTSYIHSLQAVLADAQDLILKLSLGYKTAARVDYEWRDKMRDVIKEFQAYVCHFNGGSPEANQYLFDQQVLLATDAPITDNPDEDPCAGSDDDEEPTLDIEEPDKERPWWEMIEGDCRPFVMFGDMADFKPPQRRAVLQSIKAVKTAPKKWKEYVFNDMFLRAECSNADVIKDRCNQRIPSDTRWESTSVQTGQVSRSSISSRRGTTSGDVRANMGSILKMITSNAVAQQPRSELLAARDSMEIASTTKLRQKSRSHEKERVTKLNIGNKRVSLYEQVVDAISEMSTDDKVNDDPSIKRAGEVEEEENEATASLLGSIHNDSIQMIHKPEKDHKINYEKVCPIENCKRMKMDSFVRSLPPYMMASPFTHFEQTYEDYETCSPEQLEILKQRIDDKKKREKADRLVIEPSPLDEWIDEVDGIGVQTSDIDMSLPPCTCNAPSPTPVSSGHMIFDLHDLVPFKQIINHIRMQYFYNTDIEFNRFKVVGQESAEDVNKISKEEFEKARIYEINRILKNHPSLCELFQANTKC